MSKSSDLKVGARYGETTAERFPRPHAKSASGTGRDNETILKMVLAFVNRLRFVDLKT
jgi:hypothetical protein